MTLLKHIISCQFFLFLIATDYIQITYKKRWNLTWEEENLQL